eukprot:3921909-Rhodomonas_salina.4
MTYLGYDGVHHCSRFGHAVCALIECRAGHQRDPTKPILLSHELVLHVDVLVLSGPLVVDDGDAGFVVLVDQRRAVLRATELLKRQSDLHDLLDALSERCQLGVRGRLDQCRGQLGMPRDRPSVQKDQVADRRPPCQLIVGKRHVDIRVQLIELVTVEVVEVP